MSSADLFARAFPELGTLQVDGPEAKSWLNGLITCDVKAVDPEHAAWGLALGRTGKIHSEVWVLQANDKLLLAVSGGIAAGLSAELDRMLIMEDAQLTDQSGAFQWCLLHGSGASESAARAAGQYSGWSARIVFSAEESSLLVVPAAQATAATESLPLLDDLAWTTRRLQLGLPLFGVDYGPSDRPHEAGLERRAVSWTKGCYLGQEVVCMQDMRGKVKRSLRRLSVTGFADAESLVGKSVFSGSEAIGTITSAAPEVNGCLCFASLQISKLTTPLSIEGVQGQVALVT